MRFCSAVGQFNVVVVFRLTSVMLNDRNVSFQYYLDLFYLSVIEGNTHLMTWA